MSQVAEESSRYQNISEQDRKKAEAFFTRAKQTADTGNYDYSVEMYMQGLAIDPDSVETHEALRKVSLKRKAQGGKALGMLKAMEYKRAKDDKTAMLNAERLLFYDPGNTDHMASMMKAALKGGYFDTVMWIGPILQTANNTAGKGEDFGKYMLLKDIYYEMGMSPDTPKNLKAPILKRAVEALELATAMRPGDMDLGTERKNLAAQQTMFEGNYGTGGSFRDSVRDKDTQERLMQADKEVHTLDAMSQIIAHAEKEYAADPNEPGKLMKLVEALVKTEDSERENRAIELLNQWFERTKQFRFRLNIGKIRIAQMTRMARSLAAEAKANPNDAAAKEAYEQFDRERTEEEYNEYHLWSENYPTETGYRYEAAVRLYKLGRYDEAIPVFQNVRLDPKYKFNAAIALGRAFFEAGYVDEAADTLHGIIEEYQARGDEKSKEMNYWYARALEQKGDLQAALKAYSQTAQMDFNYRDVQARIKKIRPQVK